MSVVVDLTSQRAFVYRGGRLIGISTISSGRPGHETPDGTFTVLEKDKMHHSNKYEDAPMPYMERLSWDGLALHGGHPNGFPKSHGCIRLPMGFAAALFKEATRGMKVVITGEAPSKDEILAAREIDGAISRCCGAERAEETGDMQATKFSSSRAAPNSWNSAQCATDRDSAYEDNNGVDDDSDQKAGADLTLRVPCGAVKYQVRKDLVGIPSNPAPGAADN
jgi:hypothetical protein